MAILFLREKPGAHGVTPIKHLASNPCGGRANTPSVPAAEGFSGHAKLCGQFGARHPVRQHCLGAVIVRCEPLDVAKKADAPLRNSGINRNKYSANYSGHIKSIA
jgi:hypothetical protein